LKQQKRFRVIECQGTLYEMGFQIGKQCRDNISAAIDITYKEFSREFKAEKSDIVAAAMKYHASARRFAPEIMSLIEGQAEGAGVAFEEMFMLKCGLELESYYNNRAAACTSVAVTGGATYSGKTFICQNIDWAPNTPVDLVKINKGDGTSYLSLVIWGIVEYMFNSQGLSICANGTWSTKDRLYSNIPVGIYLPKVMMQNSFEKAMQMLTQTARGLSYFQVAGIGGELAGIESVKDDYHILLPENGILAHTNHYLAEKFKNIDEFYKYAPDSKHRLERINLLIRKNYGSIGLDELRVIMSDHENHPNSICRHVNELDAPRDRTETAASFIAVPEDRVIYIAKGAPCQCEYMEYRL